MEQDYSRRYLIMKRHKYGAKKTTIDGIVFDSKVEARYYVYLKTLKERKEIIDFELQPEYVLMDKFKCNGKIIREIKLKADFLVTRYDKSKIVVDVKGKPTPVAMLKRKLFMYKYPDLELKWIVDSKWGWIDYFDKRNK